jgi:peptidoglycan L-alanyl-D-glutamate endopeptidase CwlK
MPSFSRQSLDRLNTCDPRLVKVFTEVIKHFDCTVTEGHRDQAAQHAAFTSGHSKLDWPHGNHNAMPSKAVDVYPAPVDFKDRERMMHFAGFVLGIATSMGIDLRWGGDWDEDTQVNDNSFDDLCHFEVK